MTFAAVETNGRRDYPGLVLPNFKLLYANFESTSIIHYLPTTLEAIRIWFNDDAGQGLSWKVSEMPPHLSFCSLSGGPPELKAALVRYYAAPHWQGYISSKLDSLSDP